MLNTAGNTTYKTYLKDGNRLKGHWRIKIGNNDNIFKGVSLVQGMMMLCVA